MEISQEEAKQLKTAILHWRRDPILFAKHVFKADLTPKQIEFFNAFKNNKRISFRGGTGLGKTFSMAVLTWWALVTHNQVQVTIFGPNEGNLKSVFWKEVQSMYGRMPEWIQAGYDVTASGAFRKDAPKDCFAEYKLVSKENVEGARGIHKTNNFVFVDEAILSRRMDAVSGVGANMISTDISDKQDVTATAVVEQKQAQDLMIEQVCRSFADTGYRYVAKTIIDLCVQKPEMAAQYLNDLMGPDEPLTIEKWDADMDVATNISFGMMDRIDKNQALIQFLGLQQQAMATGVVSPANIYSTLVDML